MRIYHYSILILTLLSGCEKNKFEYEDCMLKHIQSNQSEQVVEAIQSACLEKFIKPEVKICSSRDFTKSEIELLDINASRDTVKNYMEFYVYNGNPNMSLKEFKVLINADNFKRSQVYRVKTKYELEPEAAQDGIGLQVAEYPSGKWHYSIISASECKK
jgi:hypothetical protein